MQGQLIGFDQLQNLILNQAQERVYQFPGENSDSNNPTTELEIVPLGLYVVRGDNVAVISDVKDGIFEKQETSGFEGFEEGEAIKPVVQFSN